MSPNPYREVSGLDCVTELIEDVLKEQVRFRQTSARSGKYIFRTQMEADMWCINRIIGPRLELVHIDMPLDRLQLTATFTVRGKGGVECKLDYTQGGRIIGNRVDVLKSMVDFILEKLPP